MPRQREWLTYTFCIFDWLSRKCPIGTNLSCLSVQYVYGLVERFKWNLKKWLRVCRRLKYKNFNWLSISSQKNKIYIYIHLSHRQSLKHVLRFHLNLSLYIYIRLMLTQTPLYPNTYKPTRGWPFMKFTHTVMFFFLYHD